MPGTPGAQPVGVFEAFFFGLLIKRFYGREQLFELLWGIRPVKLWKCLGLRRSFFTVSIVERR